MPIHIIFTTYELYRYLNHSWILNIDFNMWSRSLILTNTHRRWGASVSDAAAVLSDATALFSCCSHDWPVAVVGLEVCFSRQIRWRRYRVDVHIISYYPTILKGLRFWPGHLDHWEGEHILDGWPGPIQQQIFVRSFLDMWLLPPSHWEQPSKAW